MNYFEVFLIGIGLSMDAFAVSVCKGLSMQRIKAKDVFTIAGVFGLFQGLMPFIGYFLGSVFSAYIRKFDYIIAFSLLAVIGGKMIWDSCRQKKADETTEEVKYKTNYRELLLLAVATSIDALAVGVTFSLEKINIYISVLIIALSTFVICAIGIFIGRTFGRKYEKRAEIAGGCILILIGIRIFVSHFWI